MEDCLTYKEPKVLKTQENNLTKVSSYKYTIDKLAKSRSAIPIPNSSNNYANIAISTIFDNAENLVLIYGQDLSGDILDSDIYLAESIYSFLSKNQSKIIMSIVNPNTKSSSWSSILKKYTNQIKLAQTPSQIVTRLNEIGINSFVVSDNDSLRIETLKDKSIESFVCFFDPKSSDSLITLFDNLI